ncbi:hypothetical protein BH24ACT1_BH24ACT1_09570 [soil metagenome]
MKLRRTAALLALPLLAVAGCADDIEVSGLDTTPTTPAGASTTTSEVPDQGVDDMARPVTVETAGDTVRAWITALAEGDLEAAWGLTAERSRAAIGGFEEFSDMRSALAEGFGAWAGTEEATFSVVHLERGDDEALSVVILRGTIAQEGPPAPAADSVPVRTTAEGNLVEPFLDLGPVDHQPPPGTVVPGDRTLVAVVPWLADAHFIVDDRRAETPAFEDAPDGRQQASLKPYVPLEPGPHSLTVVLTTAQGEVATSTALYPVEG